MRKHVIISTALGAIAISAWSSAAAAQASAASQQAQPQPSTQAAPPAGAQAQSKPTNPPEAQRDKLVDEAVAAVRETQNALTAIDQNKNDDAIAALERATGKLEIVLARTPTLALAPVDVSVVTHDVIGTPADVEKIRGEVGAAIAQGRLQLARKLISDLGSETVVNISKLPLGTYPAALKQAAALLHQGKPQEAKAVLQTALGTIVIDQIVIPLPLVRAQLALEDARSLLEKRKRTDAESARMRQLLGTARTQLQLGKALGYATDSEMTDLIASVDDLERKTAGSQSAKGLLDPFGPKFDEARRSSQRPR